MEIYNLIDAETLMRKGFTSEVMRSPELPKKWYIPKRNGGIRTIYHPSSKVKLIQYWLINNVFSNLPIHNASYAFVKKRSIKSNALMHATAKNKYYVKVDLKDFFPSIKYSNFEHAFNTYRDLIGFPTSPIIANFVAREFDEKLTLNLNSIDSLNAIYTRYADDIIISTNRRGKSAQILNAIKSSIRKVEPNFKINNDKIHICSASGGSIIATGLKICHDFHVTLHRSMKDKIRLYLSLLSKGRLKKEDYNKLSGYIAYAKSIDPHFYTKLNRKYFQEMRGLENSHNKVI
ncbi:RNA-directed DNA polymerase [Salmonella enterica]|nr:RNA-directed DNA polymerase [Salmonella enterica]